MTALISSSDNIFRSNAGIAVGSALDGDVLFRPRKAEHLGLEGPHAVWEIRKKVVSVFVRDNRNRERTIPLRCRHGGGGNAEAVKLDLTFVLFRGQSAEA